MYYKNISYTISHVFLMLFMYLFIAHRFSKKKTAGICVLSFWILNLTDYPKLNLFPENQFCYLFVTIFQIFVTQFTGLYIAKRRDGKFLFVGLSASNYVIAGSVVATILYIWTENMALSMAGSILVHTVILFVLYIRIRDIWLRYQQKESNRIWWELCLIPVFFYCGFSCLAFFPYTLDDNPQNILGVIIFIITMFVSYVVVLRYLESESEWAGIYWKNVFFESYIKGLEDQYHLVEQSERNLKILRHDMRHYSGMIDTLLGQGDYDEIRKVTAHIQAVADENKVARYCENLIANSILSHMVEKAQLCGVTVSLKAAVPRGLPFNDYEFAAVIANLLENAVRCVSEFERKEKRVEAVIQCMDGHVLVHVQNAYENEIVLDAATGLPKSQAGEGHGLGMQSVQAFSDKIGGNIGCYCEDEIFHIMLFAKI
ncbi:MAG: GHKL domain-containing protein [Lachnospiraceae bacterium]|nr:GHKL domain-containing protein [Lachnospiraceae bacterium]